MSTSFLVQAVGIENLKRLRLASESLTGALASKAADKLRASVVDVLPESPFNLTKIGGTALTGRDWSGDFAKLQNLDVALSTRASESTLSSFVGTPASSPPSKGVVLLGFDGTYLRRLKTTSDGKLLCVLG
jgi:hypothetical protein